MSQFRAFTLIELLVVITIIVVLLALLTPALDKAIYRAELLRCAANQKGMGQGVQIYATDFNRRYPYRPEAMGGQEERRISSSTNDSRPLYRPYLSVNGHLLCPFVPRKVDFDGSATTTIVEGSYSMFFGTEFRDEASVVQKGMLRLGDRWEYNTVSFTVLATDNDEIAPNNGVSYSSHPDWEGMAAVQWVQDSPPGGLGNNLTLSRWAYVPEKRPPIDSQYVLADGSVGLIEKVTWDEGDPVTGPRRVARVPNYTNGQSYTNGTGVWVHVPRK